MPDPFNFVRHARMYKARLGQWLLRSRFHPLYLAVRPTSRAEDSYTDWVVGAEAALPSSEWHRHHADTFAWKPTISVITPVCNPRREWLNAAIESVRAQSYSHWQLCICDDASEAWVAEYARGLASNDPRVRFIRSDQRLGIAGALNLAGSLASGDIVTFLDHDDVLHRYALHYIAEACQDRQVDIVYSDEDFIDESGRRVNPILKPDWSPDLLLGCMYFSHLFAVKRQSVERAGWFRTSFDGAQDYDLALRITSEPVRVRHIPLVLYHWRRHAGSTAAFSGAKPYTQAAGRRTLEDTMRRRGILGSVQDGPVPNTYYVRRKIATHPLISVVVRSRNAKLLVRCLRSLDEHTAYQNRETIVVRNENTPVRDLDRVSTEFPGIKVIDCPGVRSISHMNNAGARAASGALLIFLSEDVLALEADWLDVMAAHLERKEVGAVGAKLIYPSGAIQHAGVVVGMAGPAGHAGRGTFASDRWPWLDMTRNVSAVSGSCVGLRTPVFQELNGFDESLPDQYGSVDLCLRIGRAGYLIVYEPHAVLRHRMEDSDCAAGAIPENERFRERWSAAVRGPDPYYSPALDRTSEDIRLGDPYSVRRGLSC